MTGGVDKHRGWVLLPEKCRAKQPLIVGASSSEPISDSKAFAALITDAARAVAAGPRAGTCPRSPERSCRHAPRRPARLPTAGVRP
ncbi:hypothetical protein [Streptomyces sp. NBC_01435]|uniref:hypothetical protein n=1 Tax=Streptomyces sp. NBC_01435 TaxID=2903865 RepID=UPI002E36A8BA|nr:hypothetical protein [Streptomyces sp. NBC_01435]